MAFFTRTSGKRINRTHVEIPNEDWPKKFSFLSDSYCGEGNVFLETTKRVSINNDSIGWQEK